MTSTDDMKGLCERLRAQGKDAFAKQYSLGMWKLCDEAATALESQANALRKMEALAKQLSDALLTVRPLGGSELFIKRNGKYYADPEYLKAAIKVDSESRHKAMCERVLADRRTIAAESERDTLLKEAETFANKIIEMNVQYAKDRYGDAAEAESMACVRAARAFIQGGK